jgi:pSer/pThr/pTyr-binding forkhead associated (FHA) protein
VKPSAPRPAPQPDQTVLYDRQAPAPEPVTRTSQSLPPQLTVVKGLQPQQWVIQQTPYVIGRTEGNLVINVNSVSRKHAQITTDSRQNYFITDLNSSNGTLLNGKRLPAGQAVPLPNGAMIEVGRDIVLRFERR